MEPVFDYTTHCVNNICEVAASKKIFCIQCFANLSEDRKFRMKEHSPPMSVRAPLAPHHRFYKRESLGNTVICPRCGCDTVVGDSALGEITPELLQAWRKYLYQPILSNHTSSPRKSSPRTGSPRTGSPRSHPVGKPSP